jgi:hypothetical protein
MAGSTTKAAASSGLVTRLQAGSKNNMTHSAR